MAVLPVPRQRFTVDEDFAPAKCGIHKPDERAVSHPNTDLRDREMVVVTNDDGDTLPVPLDGGSAA